MVPPNRNATVHRKIRIVLIAFPTSTLSTEVDVFNEKAHAMTTYAFGADSIIPCRMLKIRLGRQLAKEVGVGIPAE